MTKTWSFDSELTRSYTRVRQVFISEFLDAIESQVSLDNAVDVGCGVGHFSKFLSDRGLRVVAIDGREENAKEGHRRYPEINFLTRDVEDPALPQIGAFDLLLCVGLVYHLENPFRAIRNLHAMTGKILILESMCVPGIDPSLALLDEGTEHDQGLDYIAFYPTESCLVKMLYRAGFPFVYSFRILPCNQEFTDTLGRRRSRTFLVASKLQLTLPNLLLIGEPVRWAVGGSDPWTTSYTHVRDSFRNKLSAIKNGLLRLVPGSRASAVPPSEKHPIVHR